MTSTTTSASAPLTSPKRGDRILSLHVDREVGTELRGCAEPVRVADTFAGDHDESRAGRLRRRAGREPAHSGAEHRHDVARLRVGDGDRPPDPRPERVEQGRGHRIEVRADGNEQGVGGEVLVFGVAAPQSGRAVDGHEAVHVAEAVPRASPVHARAAGVARAARQEDLDGNAVAGTDAPARRRGRADSFEDADRLVAGHERVTREEFPGVLLVIGSAQTTRLDAQQRIVVTDLGQRK